MVQRFTKGIMLITTGHQKPQTNTMRAYQRQRQYVHCHYQLRHVTPGNALLISVCILMLPMVQLSAEHVQLATNYHANPIKVDPHRMNIIHTLLVVSSLSNLLPAMILQNSIVRSYSLPTSSYFSVCYILNLSSGLGGKVVGVMFSLLLLLSGDIETNPGPVGQQLSDDNLPLIMEELNKVCVKWYNIGMMLRVRFDRLDAIKEQYSNPSDCLRETLKIWLRSYPPPPTWSNIVDALRNDTMDETKLATDLEQKYCSTQDTIIAATHHPLSATAVAPSKAHILVTTLPQFMAPLSQPTTFSPPYSMQAQPHPSRPPPWSPPHCYPQGTSPYSVPPQPHPSNPPPLSALYYSSPPTHYYPPLTSHPVSAQLLPPPPSGTASTATPPTTYSQVTLAPSSYLPTPMTMSPPYRVLPTPPSSLISEFTPPDTPPTPQPPTVTPPPEHTESKNKESVKQQVKKLEERFCDLIDCTYKALLERKVDDDVRLFRSIFLSLDVSRKHEHREFVHDHLMKVDKETTFDDLWLRLTDYCNFMNFDLLEHVVRRFAIEDLKQKMESYEHDLQSFRKATRLCDFIDCWPVRGEPSLGTQLDLKEFVAKMKHDWDSCTLEDLEELRGVITHKFFLPEFALRLREIKEGCITTTWLIPVTFVRSLQEAIETTGSEFFMKHKIKTVTVDGKDCYLSYTRRAVDNRKEQYTSHSIAKPWQSEELPQSTLPEKLHFLKADTSGEKVLLKKKHRMRLAEEMISTKTTSMVHSVKIEHPVSPPKPTFTMISQTSPTKHMSELQQTSYTHVPPVEFDPAEMHSGETLSEELTPSSKLPTHLGASKPKYGYSSALFPPTPAEKYVRDKCVDVISQRVKLLPSAEQCLSIAEVEADPSLPTKYKDYLSSTPAIRAALYTTFSAKMSAEVFTWSQHTKSSPPTTMTELVTAFTLMTLVDHLSTHPVYNKQQLNVITLIDLPTDVYKQFQDLCRMAYLGILNRQQLVFSTAHLPTGFAPLGLMQEIPQLYAEGRDSSYHFIHLTLQEYLAAIHISQLPTHEQTRLVQEHFNSHYFKMTLRFLAGLTKSTNIPPRRLKSSDTKLTYLHFSFEAKDVSVTTTILGSGEIIFKSHHSWTPLDYYVTGHAISHSNCLWWLNFSCSSIDDEKFELFCQGCAVPAVTRYRGHISHADFSNNDITSKSIQSFVNIPPHILKYTRELHLYKNKLDRSAYDLLGKAVLSMSKLQKLQLFDNPLGSGGAVEMINLSSESVANIIRLSHNSSQTSLYLSNSHFSMENVVSLASILRDQSKCTLTRLVLRDCHISGQGASELAAALCKNSTLKYLDLNHNPIGVEGASSMSDMLQGNSSLEELRLCDDSVGEEGVHQLNNILKHNQTLRKLWLPIKYKSENSDHRIIWWR